MKRKRILFISYYSILGGPNKVLYNILNTSEEKISPRFWLPLGDFADYLEKKGYIVERKEFLNIERKRGIKKWLLKIVKEIDNVIELYKALEKDEYDVIYVNGEAYWISNVVARIFKKKSYYHIHGVTAIKNRVVGKIVVKVLSKTSDKCFFVSEWVRKEYVNRGISRDKAITVRNGVDLNLFKSKEITKNKKIKVGMIANFDSRKGHERFLEICKRLKKRGLNATYHIWGGVENGNIEQEKYRERIVQQINEEKLQALIKIEGHEEEIVEVYKKLDIVVVPSEIEAGPLVPLEAMAMCIPVVATKVGGNIEAIVDGKTGYLIEKENTKQMVDRIEKLVKNEKQRIKMGKEGRMHVEGKYNIRINNLILMEELVTKNK